MIEKFRFRKIMSKLQHPNNQKQEHKDNVEQRIPSSISQCEELVKTIFNHSTDMIVQAIETKKGNVLLVYIDGLINKDITDRDIITPLKAQDFDGNYSMALKSTYKTVDNIPAFCTEVVNGNIAIFHENSQDIIIVDFKEWNKRAVETPDSESVVRGPKEGFTESIRTNTSLIRRKIRNPRLIFENITLGTQTNTIVNLVYIDGIVNRNVLDELRNRLSEIETDSILESGHIEQYIEENPFSPISGIGVSQKPDLVASRILEGRVAVLCDGTPHVLTIPELMIENIHTGEDYYNRTLYTSIIRVLRTFGILITVMLPGLAVSIITYNQEMLPSVFLFNLIASTEKTPMPTAAEVFLLILMFELLKEAGTRLPRAVGSAITIVGSLIIGDTAVNAGIVGAPIVIVVALTAVTGFIAPNLSEFIMVYRLIFLFLGSTMGLIGIGTGIFIMLTQLVSLSSFGVPILSSFSKNEMKDTIFRFPLWSMKYRPSSIAKGNMKRRK
ncbi:MAG TPA: spore germination protein [Clostridiales bacterium]|nr:spore germination protein [Clostridiales bacterium]